MKKIQFAGWLLGATGILTACGGGSAPTSAEIKASASIPTVAEVAPNVTATTKKSIHDTDAFVFSPEASQKLAATGQGIRAIGSKQKVGNALEQVAKVDLGSVPAAELSLRDQNNQNNVASGGTKAYQTGINRTIAATNSTKSFQSLLSWSTLANGNSVGSTSFASTDAVGIRLGLLVTSLPDSALVRVSGTGDPSTLEITGQHINQTIAANVSADGDSVNARTYWLPLTGGAIADMAIELPAGVDASSMTVSVPSLIHALQAAPAVTVAALTQKSDCPNINPDPTCSVPLPPAANAVGSYDFVKNGQGLVCTGTLVADKSASGTPYFLTANHCVPDQTAASTMETYWFWRSTACNSGVVNPNYVVTYGGATLRYTKSELTTNTKNPVGTDTTLLTLNAAPPAGVMFVGWTNARQAINPAVNLTALHNPLGSLLRQSTGAITGMGVFTSGDLYQTPDTNQPLYQTTWSAGITEGGSSGSGLFLDGTTSNPKIVGQLWGGASTCQAPSSPDFYGRFDLAYQNGMIDWLNPGYRMVFRFYNTTNGTHFYSANVAERDNVRATIPTLVHEGPAFSVAPSPANGLSPVYRFYNRATGVHFYTISEAERASLVPNPNFQLEGVAWYARQSPGTATVPVYRFYKRSSGTHLYTVSVAEKNNLIATAASTFNYEGIAYYAWAAN